jgi:hypothetical protein
LPTIKNPRQADHRESIQKVNLSGAIFNVKIRSMTGLFKALAFIANQSKVGTNSLNGF